MSRLVAIVAVVCVLAGLAMPASAQRLPKIGYLVFGVIRDEPTGERKAFLDGLAELGWIPGKNVEIVYRSAQFEQEFLGALCGDLAREKVEVLATVGELSTLACIKAAPQVPIVCLACADPTATGVAESLARPDRNATGLTLSHRDLAPKRIEFLKLAIPGAVRIAFLRDASHWGSEGEARSAQAAARQSGMSAIQVPVTSQADLNRQLQRIASDPPDALYVGFSPGLVVQNRTLIAQFGRDHRIAVVSAWAALTEAGGLLSYAPSTAAMFRRGAYYVDRILRGAKPAELPIEQASKLDLVINLDTARRLGLALPPDLLLRADRVIQ